MKDLELFSVITSEGEVVVGLHASPPPICELKKPIKIWFITLALGMNKIVNHPFPWCPGTSGSRTWSLSEL